LNVFNLLTNRTIFTVKQINSINSFGLRSKSMEYAVLRSPAFNQFTRDLCFTHIYSWNRTSLILSISFFSSPDGPLRPVPFSAFCHKSRTTLS
jgi:hypothetical protein